MVFCYLNQSTFFLACLAINEKRTQQNRHFATCKILDVKMDGEDDAEKCKVGKQNGVIVLTSMDERKVHLDDERPAYKSQISIHNEKDCDQDGGQDSDQNGVQDGGQNGDIRSRQGATKKADKETNMKNGADQKPKNSKSSGPTPSCSGDFCR